MRMKGIWLRPVESIEAKSLPERHEKREQPAETQDCCDKVMTINVGKLLMPDVILCRLC